MNVVHTLFLPTQIECNYYIQKILVECNFECSNTNIEKFRKS